MDQPKILANKQLILASYAEEGPVTDKHLKMIETQLDVESIGKEGSAGDVVVQNLWISVDPYLRHLMRYYTDLFTHLGFKLDEPIRSRSVSKVLATANPDFRVGDIVLGLHDVAEYAVVPGTSLRKIDPCIAPPSYYLGLLGMPGLTAWAGLMLIGDPKPGEQVFVTAAAGAVGLVVGQLAKIKGCRVVGSTSTDETVRLLKEEFGFDEAFNYKSETDWDAALSKYFPGGIDIYFENVGGRMLEAVLNHINTNARIPVCGMVSQYDQDWRQQYGVRNLLNLVGKCAKLQGFLVRNYLSYMDEFTEEIVMYMREGKIKYREDVKQGIESFLEAFSSMFDSGNIGKALVQLSAV